MANVGLIFFVSVVMFDVALLGYDLMQMIAELPTVTQLVWGGNVLLGVTIVLIQIVGVIALIEHFWVRL